MGGSDLSIQPKVDEIEISLFGPGYGESIVLHLGYGEWAVIDSCVNKEKESAPLAYLHQLGINYEENVKLVVATHWHDDHVRGLASLLEQCPNAQFACSDALRIDEFRALIATLRKRPVTESRGVQEFGKILDIFSKRNEQAKSGTRPFSSPKWAISDRIIWNRNSSDSSPIKAEIWSLSPSDASVAYSKNQIALLVPSEGDNLNSVPPPPSPNHNAVALAVRIGDNTLLLGSDLEKTKELSTGWTPILDSTARPTEKASVFKVPHHGSKTSFEPRIWEEMLESVPFAILTPCRKVPSKVEAKSILNLTDKAYSTAPNRPKEVKNRHNIVKKTIKETVISINEVQVSTGFIRLRKPALEGSETDWTLQLFGSALPLIELVN